MSKYVFSTLTSAVAVTLYRQEPTQNVKQMVKHVVIQGGANVPDKYLRTPAGVATTVSDEDLELLEQDSCFRDWVKKGFITVRDRLVDPEVAVADDMESRDASSPLTPEDLEAEGVTQPTTGGELPTTAPASSDERGNATPRVPKAPVNPRRA